MAAVITRTPGPVLTDREQLVLTRATFGATAASRRDLLGAGWEAWLDAQLDPPSVDDSALDLMVAGYDTLAMSNGELGTLRRNQIAQEADQRIFGELMHNTFLRATTSRHQLHEVLVDFWTNHLNVYLLDEGLFRHLHVESDQRVVRPNALGRFADLLAASAHSPAMLVYLDNYTSNANSAQGANENYGRELLELHTLGIVDGVQPYGEDDMLAVAKALSGWSIDTDGADDLFFTFRPAFHTDEPLSILDGAWTSSGAGYDDGVDLLSFLARHEQTSRHIAWKLCQRFVADDPPAELVESSAAVYRANDTAIAPVVRHIFHSEAFVSTVGSKLRRPLDQVAAAFRAVAATIDPDPVGPASQLLHADQGVLAVGGQRLFSHHPPDGYPDTAEEWVSADGMLRRWELAGRLAGNRLGDDRGITVDASDLLPDRRPDTVGELVDAVANRLFLIGDAVPPHGFTDVPPWVDLPVSWLTWRSVATGFSDNTYRPDDPISRAQITNWLWKLADRPTGHPDHGLTDVPPWINTAVNWLVDLDIATGFSDNTYRPDDPISRAQITNWLWKLADRPTGHPDHGLTDVPPWINTAVNWLVDLDIATGFSDNTYRPDDPISRAQITNWLHGLYHEPARVLPDADRTPLIDALGGEDARVDDDLLSAAIPDLPALLLATPTFQFR